MALILTLREGHDFYVGDKRVVLLKRITSMHVMLRTHDDRYIEIDERYAREIYPNVRIQTGIPRELLGSLTRLFITAPHIRILRGDLYHAKKENKPPKCPTCGGTGRLTQKLYTTDKTAVQEFTCPDCINEMEKV